jgi:hypothetical protein
MRETPQFTALQLEEESGITVAVLHFPLTSAEIRDHDLAEFRGGGIASEHGQSTHGAGELVDLLLLVVALGCQQAGLHKQRVDLGVE